MKKYLIIAILFFFISCKEEENGESTKESVTGIPAPTIINATVKSVYEHDVAAYTQGLEFYNGFLFESTGDFENSSLRKTDFKTGKVLEKYMMGSKQIFGEGITILKDTIYQLTWQNNIVNVYDAKNINKIVKTLIIYMLIHSTTRPFNHPTIQLPNLTNSQPVKSSFKSRL